MNTLTIRLLIIALAGCLAGIAMLEVQKRSLAAENARSARLGITTPDESPTGQRAAARELARIASDLKTGQPDEYSIRRLAGWENVSHMKHPLLGDCMRLRFACEMFRDWEAKGMNSRQQLDDLHAKADDVFKMAITFEP